MLIVLTVLFLIFPHESLGAAERGLTIWWDILFPALLPFFVISEILLGFGIVHFFGTILDPLMRPLFRIPGIGGFVMAMGFAAGYPVGAKLTTQLCEQQLLTREEGERLVAFTSTSDPIFLIGAVSVGFFHHPSIALLLAVSHYGTSVLVGLVMRFHGKNQTTSRPAVFDSNQGSIVKRAFLAMHQARLQDGRDFGTLLRSATASSLKLIMVVGGLVVFFSTMIELLSSSHFLHFFYLIVQAVLQGFHIPNELSRAVVNGIFEVTLGAKASGEAAGISLIHKAAAASFIIAWSGLSVHAQIVSIMNSTGLRYLPFLFARALHACLAASSVYVLWDFYLRLQPKAASVAHLLPTFRSVPHVSEWHWMVNGVVFLILLMILFFSFGIRRMTAK